MNLRNLVDKLAEKYTVVFGYIKGDSAPEPILREPGCELFRESTNLIRRNQECYPEDLVLYIREKSEGVLIVVEGTDCTMLEVGGLDLGGALVTNNAMKG